MQSKKIINCGRLFDGKNEFYHENVSIVVEHGKIMDIKKIGEIEDKEIEVIDLTNKFVTPGLMEIHNHPCTFKNDNVAAILNERMCKSSTYSMMGVVHHLNKLLESGFTLVRECASIESGWEIVDVRDAIKDGVISGPEFIICGHSGSSIASHMDLRQFASRISTHDVLKLPSIGSGAEFFREWVRLECLHGVDFIKIHIDGGFATPGDHPDQKHLTNEEIKAIIETAHSCGLRVTAHIYSDKSAIDAINLGIDGIEHGALLSSQVYDLMSQKNVYLVPTMTFFDRGYFLEEEELAKVPSFMANKYRQLHPRLVESRKALIKHIENDTLLVGYGTDFGAVEPTLPAYKEFETMIKSGISPFKALKIATSNSAKIVERQDLGIIEKGKQADIVAWNNDPVKDYKALRECKFVMKNGKVVKLDDKIYKTV